MELFSLNTLKTIASNEKIEISEKEIEKLYNELKSWEYFPQPVKKIEINTGKKIRPITISEKRDKLVQKILAKYLNEIYNHSFSDKSYGYRPNKGTLKAINRVGDFIRRWDRFVLKTDIKDFFETIDHEILKNILSEKIKDENLINLIVSYLKIGMVFDYEYIDHNLGVYQGNVISPILSNIYLDKMDKFLEKEKVDFVRFADDFVILTKEKQKAEDIYKKLIDFLKEYKLSLNYEKTYISSIDSGFEFLGVYFTDKFRTIAKDRVEKINEKILSYSKLPLDEFIQKMNLYYHTIKNYYLKISPHNKFVKNAVINSCVEKIYNAKKRGEIKTKTEIKEALNKLLFLDMFQNRKKTVELIIKRAYNRLYSVEKKVKKQKKAVTKRLTLESVIHIFEYGLSLGISKNKFVLKKYGKVIKTFPFAKISRILIEGKGISISSNVIEKCAKNKIHIDFIDKKANPYASVYFYNASMSQMITKQAMVLNTTKHIELAKAFVYSKLKNQKNLLVYFDKYHNELDREIDKLKEYISNLKNAKSVDEVMGIEGIAANVYWSGFGKLIEMDFKRVTKNAADEINAALNYGYAILYGKIQRALIEAGLSLHISYLHSLDKTKPTLVFDMIEEFRSYVVDRSVIALVNKNVELKLNSKGLLDEKSRKKIASVIYERLGSFVNYKGESVKLENVFLKEAYNLKNAILSGKKYRPFIGRY
ncbi:CRISPR-associated endonuclease Cas1 [Caminibacter sp.]